MYIFLYRKTLTSVNFVHVNGVLDVFLHLEGTGPLGATLHLPLPWWPWPRFPGLLSVVLVLMLKDRNLSNNSGTTHYDSLQGSYWEDQRTAIMR